MKKDNYRIRKVKVEVRGIPIEYDEYFVVDDNGNEIFDRTIEMNNDRRLYDIYKKECNLLTKEEIKSIRKKYDLTQKEYALVLGFGEVTINRIERGSIQTEALDSIIRLSKDPNNMSFLIQQNKGRISNDLYKKTINIIDELRALKKHRIANISNISTSSIDKESVLDIADNIIDLYNNKADELASYYNVQPEYITNLKLQKLLYFVQGLCLLIYDKPAFIEDICAWDYGPVVEEVYHKFKNNKSKEIIKSNKPKKISQALLEIIKESINSYGSIESTKLIDITHEEYPWKETKRNGIISIDKIRDYYKKVYL